MLSWTARLIAQEPQKSLSHLAELPSAASCRAGTARPRCASLPHPPFASEPRKQKPRQAREAGEARAAKLQKWSKGEREKKMFHRLPSRVLGYWRCTPAHKITSVDAIAPFNQVHGIASGNAKICRRAAPHERPTLLLSSQEALANLRRHPKLHHHRLGHLQSSR